MGENAGKVVDLWVKNAWYRNACFVPVQSELARVIGEPGRTIIVGTKAYPLAPAQAGIYSCGHRAMHMTCVKREDRPVATDWCMYTRFAPTSGRPRRASGAT